MASLVLFSGGVDSTTLLYEIAPVDNVVALSFLYGQRHDKELLSAKKIADRLGVKHIKIDVTELSRMLFKGALIEEDVKVPEGYYTEESQKITVVPNRNGIFVNLAIAYAITNGFNRVYYAAHSGDVIYPDCSVLFYNALRKIARAWNIELEAPYIYLKKKDIVARGLKLGIPYKLTWSCYNGLDRPCLKCGTCTERTEAFYLNGVKDPLLTDKEWEEAVRWLKKHRSL